MDLAGSGRADVLATPAQAAGEQARLRALARDPKGNDREDLARVAREFEGVFLDILMRSMRSTVPDGGLTGTGGATQIYRQMHDTELARTLAGTGDGLGIARLLEAQFAEQFAEDEAAGDLAGPAAPPATPLALARYRAAMPPRLDAAPRVQDLGELPSTPLSAPPGWPAAPAPAAPAATADTPVTGVAAAVPAAPAVPPAAAAADAAEPAAPRAEDAEGRRQRRPNLLPADRRLAAAPLHAAEADTVRRFGAQIETAAAASGLDPRLVLAVVMEESGGDPAARSRAGARGLMQLMPGTARDLGVRDAGDPAANLKGGSRYLAEQLDRFGGRLDLALAAYNAGPGNVDRAGGRIPAFPETRNYVARVMDRYERLRTGTELDRAAP